MNNKLKSKARSLTHALRHKPEQYGLSPIVGGWFEIDDILLSLNISREELVDIVQSDNKGRFAINTDENTIRANQGHSYEVDLQLRPVKPPTVLYHGTVEKFIGLIKKDGLKKMSRHHVHLSEDEQTATQVASRRSSDNVLLEVDALSMYNDGFEFFKTENGVWLTDKVPPKYIY